MSDGWKIISKNKKDRPKVLIYKNWKDLPPIPISFPDNIMQTGDWRSFKPVLDKSKCTKCGLCWLYCPEGVITHGSDGYFEIDYKFCKGCGICCNECPNDAMKMEKEQEEI